jgi:hypothetical protein
MMLSELFHQLSSNELTLIRPAKAQGSFKGICEPMAEAGEVPKLIENCRTDNAAAGG